MQYVDKEGVKKFIKGSELEDSFCSIKKPVGDYVYLCEGIRTGLTILDNCPKKCGVVCAGSLYNIENIVKAFKKKYKIIICSEKAGYDKYIVIKNTHNVFCIGNKDYDDLHDYLIKTNRDCVKRILTNCLLYTSPSPRD